MENCFIVQGQVGQIQRLPELSCNTQPNKL